MSKWEVEPEIIASCMYASKNKIDPYSIKNVAEFVDAKRLAFNEYIGTKTEALKAEIEKICADISVTEREKSDASAQGDRSENAEYHAAVAALDNLNRELRVKRAMQDAYDQYSEANAIDLYIIIDRDETKNNQVGHSLIWMLVPDIISDHSNGMLSVDSPVGKVIKRGLQGSLTLRSGVRHGITHEVWHFAAASNNTEV